MLFTIIKETLRGKTLPRTLMNLALKRYTKKKPLQGSTLDLGSKSDKMSYNRFIERTQNCKITYTDINPKSKDVKKLDIEKKFPIKEGTYDNIICFNTLEHIYNYKNAIEESARIIKKGGLFIGTTPFLIMYHADPNDYFRYTHTALKKIFSSAGFEKIKIRPLGIGIFSTGLYNFTMLSPRLIRPILVIGLVLLDKLLNLITRKRHTGKTYTLTYFFVFRKK